MSDWKESQLVQAAVMAAQGAKARAIAHAIGKEIWQVRNKLCFHGVPLLMQSGARLACLPVKLPQRLLPALQTEAERRGYAPDQLVARIIEIAVADRLFDAVLGELTPRTKDEH